MHLDLTDPASIRAWVAVCPARHRAMLAGLRRLPLFKPLIDSAIDGARSAAPSATSSATTPATAQGDHP